MEHVLELKVKELIEGESNFKDRIQVLADSAGIRTRSRRGISCDIVSLRGIYKEMSYVTFIISMLILMVRSYTGKDDTKFVPTIRLLYDLYHPQMEISELLFYRLLIFRLGQVEFETPPWNEESAPVQASLIGDFTARDNTPVRIALIGEEEPDFQPFRHTKPSNV
jgi:hypothetical protein